MPTLSPAIRSPRSLGHLFLGLAALTWSLIAFGALVRAHQAGLSCPDWPLCHGVVLPDLKMDGVVYEFGHRVLAGLVALIFAFGALQIWRDPSLKARLGRWAWAGTALLIVQIVFGGLTVLIVHRGDGDPRPATWTVATHLLLGNTFAAVALLIGLRLRLGDLDPIAVPARLRTLAIAWTLSLFAQFILGGSVAASIGGLVCTEFPTCNGGVWFPAWTGLVGLQVWHRLNAYLLLALGIALWRGGRGVPRLQQLTTVLGAGVVLQGVVGATNVLMLLRADVTTAHSAIAALLYSSTAALWWTLGAPKPRAGLLTALLCLLPLGCATQEDNLVCNGSHQLCDRRFDEVTFATAHNGMSNKDEGWTAPNQNHGLVRQLDDGIRGFMIDVHPYDGDDDSKTGQTYLCHSTCLLGSENFADAMLKMRVWLDAHPHEVITFIYEDYVPEEAMDAALAAAGMLPMCLHMAPGKAFPTLREMIDSNRRIFIMTESGGGKLAWNHGYQTFAWDTNYHFEKAADFSCALLRGKASNPLFVVNHFITNPMASVAFAQEVNVNPLLLDRARQCQSEGKQHVNYLAVDFYDVGDVVADAARLNGL